MPPLLTENGLKNLQQIASTLDNNDATHLTATFIEEELRALVTPRAADNVRQLLTPRHRALGSVQGRLETISLHRRATFHVYDTVTQRAVRCIFDAASIEKVKDALGSRVLVSGTVVRNRIGQPLQVQEPTLTLLPSEDELPSIESLIGVDPRFTGDLSSGEYVRQLNDA